MRMPLVGRRAPVLHSPLLGGPERLAHALGLLRSMEQVFRPDCHWSGNR